MAEVGDHGRPLLLAGLARVAGAGTVKTPSQEKAEAAMVILK